MHFSIPIDFLQQKLISILALKFCREDFRAAVVLLVRVELPVRQLDLFSGLECRHAEVGAAGASERIAKVTL